MEEQHEKVLRTLEYARRRGYRLRLFYGNDVTGRDWGEEHDVLGYVGHSTGRQPVFILLHNARSIGGGAISESCIVKIVVTRSRKVLYKHPSYHQPRYRIGPAPKGLSSNFPFGVYADGSNVANFRKVGRATRWVAFMTGKRMAP